MARKPPFVEKAVCRYRFLVLFIAFILLLSGCGEENKAKKPTKKLRIGLMITPKGLNDKGFNDSAYDGLKEAEKKYNIIGTIIEPATMKDPVASLRFFAGQKFDAIIAVGLAFVDAIKKISAEQPNLKFYIIDSDIDKGNIQGISFKEEEGAFLCGYIAAKMAQNKKIGFIGGMDIPVIERFKTGYINGAKYADKDVFVQTEYVANDFSGFNNAKEANKIALEMYHNGCDVIFPAAGASGLGVISAAVQIQKYVMGVDMNQDALAPGLVLTSMIKHVDTVVEDIVKTLNKNSNAKIKRSYGLADGGITLSDFQLSYKVIGEPIIQEVSKIKKQIIEGKINPLKPVEQATGNHKGNTATKSGNNENKITNASKTNKISGN